MFYAFILPPMMTTFLTLVCLFPALGFVGFLNIILYPVSKAACVRVSDYIVSVCAPRIFAMFALYKHFRFIGYPDRKNELPEQFLLVSNHQSLLDIPLYMKFLRGRALRFVAKAELSRYVPVVSEMLRAHEHCMISRTGNAACAMSALDSFADRVSARRQIPVIFPEGTRSRDGRLGAFYAAGARRLLTRAPMPVAVCALEGGYRIASLRGIARNLRNGSYRVKILKIYPTPRNKEEQAHILEEGKALIQAQLDAWRQEG